MLVSYGDLSKVRAFLDEYLSSQPQKETVSFCENSAVNALLNYYLQMAKRSDIREDWEVSMPDKLSPTDTDLCSILGNILENAILACNEVPMAERFIDLTICTKADSMLCIVVTNSFDGNASIDGNTYISTREHGSGLGLRSIKETAEKYGGSARFSHEGKEFYSDVLLPV